MLKFSKLRNKVVYFTTTAGVLIGRVKSAKDNEVVLQNCVQITEGKHLFWGDGDLHVSKLSIMSFRVM